MTEFNPFSLKGKTILITGASSGIGQQCAIDCSKMGAKVLLIARNEERLQDTLSCLEGDGQQDGINNIIGEGDVPVQAIAKEGGQTGHAAGYNLVRDNESRVAKHIDEQAQHNHQIVFEGRVNFLLVHDFPFLAAKLHKHFH